jgi:hypothetical protein
MRRARSDSPLFACVPFVLAVALVLVQRYGERTVDIMGPYVIGRRAGRRQSYRCACT